MRISLRELLILSGVVAVGIATLLYGGPITSGVVVSLVGVITIAMVIRALVESDVRRSTAIGFAVTSLAYLGILIIANDAKQKEFDPYDGDLPTTRVLQPIIEWAWSQQEYYLDPQGKVSKQPPPQGTTVMSVRAGQKSWGGNWSRVEVPHREDFMMTGHALWTLLFAFLGSKYAGHVYRHREQRQRSA